MATEVSRTRGPWEFFHWIVTVAALLLLLVALSIENQLFLESPDQRESVIFNVHAIAALCKEIAFALIIALVISLGIERQARVRDAEVADQARREIAEDVFKGVFAAELPAEYVNAVVRSALRRSVIRLHYKETMTFSQVPFSLEDDGAPYLRQHSVVVYRIKNVSRESIQHPVRNRLPVISALMADSVGVTRMRVGQIELSQEEIAAIREPHRGTVEFSYDVTMAPGETIDVLLETVAFKERSDNALWATFVPTMHYELNVKFEGVSAEFGFIQNSTTPVQQIYYDGERGVGHWVIDGPVLPNETAVVWWRPN